MGVDHGRVGVRGHRLFCDWRPSGALASSWASPESWPRTHKSSLQVRVTFLQGWTCLAWSVVSLLPLDVCKWKLDEPGQDTGSWGARKSFGESQTAYQGLFI